MATSASASVSASSKATGAPASDFASLSLSGLRKTYGSADNARALDDFSLDFPAGQCTVLLGPSGCGKTTVLRSIAGLIRPDAGRIVIGDSVVFDAATGRHDPPEMRRLGMVFQSYALWPHLTIAGNIAYPLLGSRLSKAEVAKKTEAMLEWVGLGGMGNRFVHELSGGQQQRVSLGRAMIGKPQAILFDEPLSNLDARLRERMRMELLTLRQAAPFTSIYVTHDQLEAMTLGDRVVVMRAGQIEQVGAPEAVYRRPRTRFVADFVGIPNLLQGTVQAVAADEIAVATAIGTLRTQASRAGWTVGSPCTVAVRPTLVQMGSSDAAGDQRTGHVIRSVFQGTSTVTFIDVGGTTIAVESLGEERHAPGSMLAVKPAAGAVFALLDD